MFVIRLTVRRLLQRPLFALLAIAMTAVGIGANLAVFSVADAVLLHPLPYPDPERLAVIWETGPHDYGDEVGVSLLDYRDWQRSARSFSSLAAYAKTGFNLADDASADYVEGAVVSANFFATLGAAPARGRTFVAADDREGGPRVAVLSDALWRRRFGADPSIVGRTITISGEPHVVNGVMAPSFRAPEPAELWVPLSWYRGNAWVWRATHPLTVIGRLAPGATSQAARDEVRAIASAIWSNESVGWQGWSVRVVPLLDQLYGDYRGTVRALWIAVALLLLITCANLTHLLLMRNVGRAHELSVRSSLGATRGRIIADVLGEGTVIAIAGSAAGLALGAALFRAATTLLPFPLAWSGGTILYAVGIALGTALLIGVVPVARVLRQYPGSDLSVARGSTRRPRIGYAFVLVQVALSVPLLAASFLLVRTIDRLGDVGTGVRPAGVLTFRTIPTPALYRDPVARAAFYRRVEEQLAALPGVTSAGLASNIPFSRLGTQTSTSLFVEGRDTEDARNRAAADVRTVSAGAAGALGLALVRGRWIEDRDHQGPRVAVVNETAARRIWPNEDPISARIVDGNETDESPARWFTVVGIVADARSAGLRSEPVPEVYLPFGKRPSRAMTFIVRTSGDPSRWIEPARAAVARVDRRQPIFEVATLGSLVAASIATQRLALLVFSTLGGIALLLTTIGTYAVATYAAGMRRRELGVRASLGAAPAALGRLLLRDGVAVAATGAAIGCLLTLLGAGLLESVVYGVRTTDAFTHAGGAMLAIFAAIAACALPARAAMRIDPAEALKEE
jgi:putative ABC transport system permease protein